MKKLKLMFLVIGIIIVSCKKTEILNGSAQDPNLYEKEVQIIKSNTQGLCTSDFIQNMRTFISNWGIGSSSELNSMLNPNFLSDRIAAHNAVYTGYSNCQSNTSGGTFVPADRSKPFLYFLPPVNLNDWMTFLGATNLCDQNQINDIKTFIEPLNAIIKRTVDDVGDSYYTCDADDRFELIIMHMYASEATYLDENQANSNYRGFLYLKAASYLFKVPNVVANKLFDKPLAPVDPVEGGSPVPIINERWQGFIIDHTANINVLNSYCTTPPSPTFLYLPNPLPSYTILYFLTISDAQNTIVDKSIDTPIFLNIADNKYYTNGTFMSLVPDGYYKHPNDYLNNTYYHIVNGLVLGSIEILIDPNAPVGP